MLLRFLRCTPRIRNVIICNYRVYNISGDSTTETALHNIILALKHFFKLLMFFFLVKSKKLFRQYSRILLFRIAFDFQFKLNNTRRLTGCTYPYVYYNIRLRYFEKPVTIIFVCTWIRSHFYTERALRVGWNFHSWLGRVDERDGNKILTVFF